MFCINCGAKINDGDSFCTNCGMKVVKSIENDTKTTLAELIKNVKTVQEYSNDIMVDNMMGIKFGLYPQSDVNGEIKEPIEWLVIDKKTDRVLLLSKYILEFKQFGIFSDYRVDEPCWENSTIREWLNKEFIKSAFNESEQSMILQTNVINITFGRHNTIDFTEKATNDFIFLLNVEEMETYFNLIYSEDSSSGELDENKKCTTRGTHYSKREANNYVNLGGLNEEERQWDVWWNKNDTFWLRSHGKEQGDASEIVYDGKIRRGSPVSYLNGVRPAMWVKI